jgi:CHAT domain-containing protein/Tfp pilus assembly protein PilF
MRRFLNPAVFAAIAALLLPLSVPDYLTAEGDLQPFDIRELLDRADSLLDERQSDSAAILGRLVLEAAKRQFGESDTVVASALGILGRSCYYKAEYAECESLWTEALVMREEILGPDHPDVASSLYRLAVLRYRHADYARAESLYTRSLEIREAALGPDHKDVASCLNGLGVLYYKQADFERAESLYARALSIREKALGPEHLDVTKTLNNLAVLYKRLGKYNQAGALFERVLDIRTRTLGPNNPSLATSLNNLAALRMSQGKYGEAEPLYRRAFEMRERTLGPNHPVLISSLTNLANLYDCQRRYEESERLGRRALDIAEKALGPDHPDVARCLNSLAVVCRFQRKYDEAELFHKRALEIRETSLGPEHPDVTESLNNLASVYYAQELYDEAEALYLQALDIRERTLGPNSPGVALSLKNLTAVHSARGEYAQAESLCMRALDILEDLRAIEDPGVGNTLEQLATIYGSMGELEKALDFYERLQRSRHRFVEHVFSYASEGQKMRYIEQYPLLDHSFVSFAMMSDLDESRRAALEMILKAKAVVIDAVAAEREAAYCSYDDDVMDRVRRHAEACGEISTLILAASGRSDLKTYHHELGRLFGIKDSLETELSRTCAEFRDELAARRFTVADVAAALPEDAALWEFIRYVPHDFTKGGRDEQKTGPPRYAGFTLNHKGEVTLTDLGDASETDSLVAAARKLIYRARLEVYSPRAAESERRLREATSRLRDIVFTPLEPSLDTLTRVFISPDGQLSLLPFEILPCGDGKYTIEKYAISYLSSGRDLLRFSGRDKPGDWALIIADPDFQLSDQQVASPGETVPDISDVLLFAHQPSRGMNDCLRSRFDPLPHSREEARLVAETLREKARLQVELRSGADALEEGLKAMEVAPRVLHFATHGYFCEDVDSAHGNAFENPLLRSGLALAGANGVIDTTGIAADRSEDGVLTGFEASGLNLVGTELVVLSACESGIGEVRNGEGVYGLRRAFQCAGARSVVMSLWQIPDKETSELMNGFYEKWSDGSCKCASLRYSILSVLDACRARYGIAHPVFWGGFVLVGAPD